MSRALVELGHARAAISSVLAARAGPNSHFESPGKPSVVDVGSIGRCVIGQLRAVKPWRPQAPFGYFVLDILGIARHNHIITNCEEGLLFGEGGVKIFLRTRPSYLICWTGGKGVFLSLALRLHTHREK